jgi:hypothetical protein
MMINNIEKDKKAIRQMKPDEIYLYFKGLD